VTTEVPQGEGSSPVDAGPAGRHATTSPAIMAQLSHATAFTELPSQSRNRQNDTHSCKLWQSAPRQASSWDTLHVCKRSFLLQRPAV